jgi:hypothetical protein
MANSEEKIQKEYDRAAKEADALRKKIQEEERRRREEEKKRSGR